MNVYFLSLKEETPKRGYWDYAFLEDALGGRLWKPHNFPKMSLEDVEKLPEEEKAIVVIPARHHADKVDEINQELQKIKHVILFLMGDEESDFPVEKLKHDKIYIWVMSPRPGRHDEYNKFGTGYPPHARELKNIPYNKNVDIFFSGQITHPRRRDMMDNLLEYEVQNGKQDINGTKGFTQGFEPKEYIERLAKARIVPAPSGPVHPDSFRLFEGLESMACVIADEQNPDGSILEYWDWFFEDDTPFKKIKKYDNLVGYIYDIRENWSEYVAEQTAWWIQYKRKFVYKLMEQING